MYKIHIIDNTVNPTEDFGVNRFTKFVPGVDLMAEVDEVMRQIAKFRGTDTFKLVLYECVEVS